MMQGMRKNVNVLTMIFAQIALKMKPNVKTESFTNARTVHGLFLFVQIMFHVIHRIKNVVFAIKGINNA